jgi:hypothetical protein
VRRRREDLARSSHRPEHPSELRETEAPRTKQIDTAIDCFRRTGAGTGEKTRNARGGLTIVGWRNKLLRMIECLELLPQGEFPNASASLRCAR